MDPIENRIAETIARQKAEDAAAEEALQEPLPGELKFAYNDRQEIEVNGYTVYPCCDYLFNVLSHLESPFHKMFLDGKGEKHFPTGDHVWNLCWILTRPAREVQKLIKEKGYSAVKLAGEEEFAFKKSSEVAPIAAAAIEQIGNSWKTAIGYKEKQDGEAAKATGNPT